MSRIGKMPIEKPAGITITRKDNSLSVKGAKGELTFALPTGIDVKEENGSLVVFKTEETPETQALWGTVRSVINNMVQGVSTGFQKQLQFVGVGYRVAVKGSELNMNLGFSHPVIFKLPKAVTGSVEKNVLTLESYDKVLLGNIAAKIRKYRPPEPYKGKGIMYVGEHIVRKAGKAGAK